jgi:hypothetical protein
MYRVGIKLIALAGLLSIMNILFVTCTSISPSVQPTTYGEPTSTTMSALPSIAPSSSPSVRPTTYVEPTSTTMSALPSITPSSSPSPSVSATSLLPSQSSSVVEGIIISLVADALRINVNSGGQVRLEIVYTTSITGPNGLPGIISDLKPGLKVKAFFVPKTGVANKIELQN